MAAGILHDLEGRILISERCGDSPFAGLWEFPGGKIRTDETPAAALHRELAEELGICVVQSRHFMSLLHEYADRSVAIDFYIVRGWDGRPCSCEGQELAWRHPADIAAHELLPADGPVLEALQRRAAPPEWRISRC